MNFREWIIKTFHKDKAVIVYVIDESNRIKKHWCLPDASGNSVRVTGIENALVISNETKYLTTKYNIPTYYLDYSNCESLDLRDTRKSYYTAQEFRDILDNDEARKVFQATQNGKLTNESLIILVAIFLGFLFIGYFFNAKFSDLETRLPEAPIVEVVEESDAIE